MEGGERDHGASATDDAPTLVDAPSGPGPSPSSEPTTTIGASLGRYVVLEEIGRGGMGRVLRAYDPKLQREVAVKEVRQERISEEAAARLVAEARAMAKLSHPNVVPVYDVEHTDGRLVLVMEYVPGETLGQWNADRERPWKEVVDHYRAAGRGLAAAHAAGVLHRDFKPANVLVAAGTVKVTDFGIAKLEESSSLPGSHDALTLSSGDDISGSSSDALTEAGMVMGTPRYMAPEQLRGKKLGPAVDQYAFCVALWEALCGEPPFSAPRDKNHGPPPWPRRSVPKPIAEAIRRGLAADPAARWPSMDALLSTLGHDPARRRRAWLASIGAVTVITAVVFGTQAWSSTRAERCAATDARAQLAEAWDDTRRDEVETGILGIEASYAAGVWKRTAEALDAYADEWVDMHVDACAATSIRGEQSTEVLDLRMACLHRAKLDLAATTTVLADADPEVVSNAHQLTASLPPLSRCDDIEALQADVEPPLPHEAEAVEAAHRQLAAAHAARKAGRYDDARAALEAATQRLQDDAVQYGPIRAELALSEGYTFGDRGEYDASDQALRRAIELAAQFRQWPVMADASARLVFLVGYQQHHFEEALRYRDLALGLVRDDPVREANLRNHLALVQFAQGEYAEAEAGHRQALAMVEAQLGLDHPRATTVRNSLANALHRQGKYEEAEAEHRQALASRIASLGEEHPHVAVTRNNLAVTLYAQGKYEEAELQHRLALAARVAALGPDHSHVADSLNNLGIVLYRQHEYEEAEARQRRALALRLEAFGPEHPNVAASRSNLALTLAARGELEAAAAEHRAAIASLEAALGPEHPHVGQALLNLANLLQRQGKPLLAEQAFRRSLSIRLAALGDDHPDVATTRSNLAALLLERGEHDEARRLAEAAWKRRQQDDTPETRKGETAFLLARLRWAQGDPEARDEARALARTAREAYDAAENADEEDVAQLRAWLGEHGIE